MQVHFSDIYIFLRDHVAALENIVWLLIWLAARKLHFYNNHIAYFIEQTSTIYSVDTGFPNNTKYSFLIVNVIGQGWAISGPRATCGPPHRFQWPARAFRKNP